MVGDKTFLTFQPVSNVPTDDNSVTVTFKVTLPQVVKEAEYESYITCKLDGVEQQELYQNPPWCRREGLDNRRWARSTRFR